jgi:hypothetical protein
MAIVTTNSTNTMRPRTKLANSAGAKKSSPEVTAMTLLYFKTELSPPSTPILVPTQHLDIAKDVHSFHLSHRRVTLDYRDLTALYKDVFGKRRQEHKEDMRLRWSEKEKKKAALAVKVKDLSAADKKKLLSIFTHKELIQSTDFFKGNNVYERDLREIFK